MLQPTEVTNETPGRLKWRRLETISEVRLALAVVVKKCFDGKLEPKAAAACVNGLRALGKTILDSDVEARLRALEDRLRQ